LDERYVAAILPGNTLRVHFSHERGFLREAQKMRPNSPYLADNGGMNAIAVLYGGALRSFAFEEAREGKSAFALALQNAASFEGVSKIALLVTDDFDSALLPPSPRPIELVRKPLWRSGDLFESLAALGAGFDLLYYAWADTPFLDAALAKAIAERFIRYAAEYAYADGWPGGLAPEALLPSTAAFLLKLDGGANTPLDRGTVFSVLQKDINAFDIETEIAPVDLRGHRLNLAADSKRNLLLIRRFAAEGWAGFESAEKIIAEKPEILRTLPAFFPVMVSDLCPRPCALCPFADKQGGGAFLPAAAFRELLERIVRFAGDALIDLSLWGEIALHPEKNALIAACLERPELSLIIETCGLGWTDSALDEIAALSRAAPHRENGCAALSWIVSLDAAGEARYNELHGAGFSEAVTFTQKLIRLFPGDVYAQALRVDGAEDDVEQFYRFWKEAGAKLIIQKYDYFCGQLPQRRAGDISPLTRNVCWHILRDMPILLDGTVPVCRETIVNDAPPLGNAFSEPLETIWERGLERCRKHGEKNWTALCEQCDEYYTYNF
jgi:spiro-SPASM protein